MPPGDVVSQKFVRTYVNGSGPEVWRLRLRTVVNPNCPVQHSGYKHLFAGANPTRLVFIPKQILLNLFDVCGRINIVLPFLNVLDYRDFYLSVDDEYST